MRERLVLRVLGVGTLALAAAYGMAAASLPRVMFGDPMGPRAFPFILSFFLALGGVLILWETRALDPDESDVALPHRRDFVQVAFTLVVAALYAALLTPLGYVVATSIFLAALVLYYDPGHTVRSVVVAIGFSLASYVLFRQLQVTLPSGILPF
jgi:putative tricarboxylic transport membrane protein